MATVTSSETACLHRESNGERAERIRTAAVKMLRSCGYGVLWGLRCEVHDGVVRIGGVVPTFYLKQVAQATVLRPGRLERIRGVENLVEVR
jgi:hypothetical protein